MPLPTTPNPYAIELVEDEQIEYVTKRHWMLLLYHLAIPLLLMLAVGALVTYRWLGGEFIVFNAAPRGLIDSANVVLLIGVALCGGGLALSLRRKQMAMMWGYATVAALCLVLFAFRYQGGRVFGINPFEAAGTDLINRVLIGVLLLLALVCVYLWVDWRNDTVILTNRRVVHDRRDLFHRHIQDQILIEKIESAKASKRTYLTHWLDAGVLVIQATTVGRRMVLEMADEPGVMADKIGAKLKKLKNTRTEAHFVQMVDQYVYNDKRMQARPPLTLRVRQAPKMLNWLFFDNPAVDDSKGEVSWYSHWIFVFLSVTLPFTVFVAGVALLLISIRISSIVGLWSLLLGVILLAICAGWGLWRYKDVIDDELILTPTNIIKIDKLPFGPEKRRTAGLGASKNVSYRSSFIGRLIGYGTVEVQTAGPDTNMHMHQVPDPREVVATIYEYMVEFKANERERTLNDTLALLKHFHQSQQDHGEFYDGSSATPTQA